MSRRTESPAPAAGQNGEGSGRNHQRAESGGSPSGTQVNPAESTSATTPRPSTSVGATASATETGPLTSAETFKLRLVPHLESSRSLHFDPIDRDLTALSVLRVGRFTDRSSSGGQPDPLRIAFKSKVVSRGHAEVWSDEAGKFYIKDTKSSSGTFLNHIRLSAPGAESRAFPLKDGDVLQLGVDYQGGTEEIYRCVKMRVELNRSWQRGMNSFNTAALAQLRALGGAGASPMEVNPTAATAVPSAKPAQKASSAAATASVTDCCICLYPVTVCQALFIAPCSHVTHFKCIRPLVQQNYPGFSCPLCRTYSDLEADVEIEPFEEAVPESASASAGENEGEGEGSDLVMASVEEGEEPRDSRAPSVRLLEESSRRSSMAVVGPDGLPFALGSRAGSRAGSRSGSRVGSRAGSRAGSRSGSIRARANADETLAGPPSPADAGAGPRPLGMAIGTPSRATADETEAWLASAATPPNSTFLSTLADSGVASLPHSRYQAPVSLGMALNGLGEAGPSSGAGGGGEGSVSSGTSGAREEEGGEVAGEDRGKGKGRAEGREGGRVSETDSKREEGEGALEAMQGVLST